MSVGLTVGLRSILAGTDFRYELLLASDECFIVVGASGKDVFEFAKVGKAARRGDGELVFEWLRRNRIKRRAVFCGYDGFRYSDGFDGYPNNFTRINRECIQVLLFHKSLASDRYLARLRCCGTDGVKGNWDPSSICDTPFKRKFKLRLEANANAECRCYRATTT